MDRYDLVIGGKQTPAADGATFEVEDPATGQPMAEVARAGPEDARRAVDAAHQAFHAAPRAARP